jgi:hypothetical protein
MPPKSRDSRIRLLEPLATEMAAYRAAVGQGVTEIGVIREAVREFIRNRTMDGPLKELYETELRRLMAEKPLRLVTDSDDVPSGRSC